jgi:hydrogenase-4 component F
MLPFTGILWILGFFAITGTPPFSTFLSEFTILMSAIDQGRIVIAAAYLLLLALVFIGMVGTMLRMAQGEGSVCTISTGRREAVFSILSPAVMAAVVLLLGFAIPGGLNSLLREAAHALGGG